MATIDFSKYTVEVDNYNASVYYNYVGKDKNSGEAKPATKLVGHFNPRITTGCVQAIEAIIKHSISQEDKLTLQDFIEFSKVNKENIQSWVSEAWNK